MQTKDGKDETDTFDESFSARFVACVVPEVCGLLRQAGLGGGQAGIMAGRGEAGTAAPLAVVVAVGPATTEIGSDLHRSHCAVPQAGAQQDGIAPAAPPCNVMGAQARGQGLAVTGQSSAAAVVELGVHKPAGTHHKGELSPVQTVKVVEGMQAQFWHPTAGETPSHYFPWNSSHLRT